MALASLIAFMRFIEYQFFTKRLSIDFYVGIVALFFTALGIWAGLKLTRKKVEIISPEFIMNEAELTQLDITKRELEVLELMASGHSNQEIADKLFVSLNTIKTHTSNLFLKLEVNRRTKAVQKARQLRIIR